MYHHWLVAHDFEPCATCAADAAARVALACQTPGSPARVVLAHVVTPPVMPMPADVIGGGANALAAIDIMMSTSTERLQEEARPATTPSGPHGRNRGALGQPGRSADRSRGPLGC